MAKAKRVFTAVANAAQPFPNGRGNAPIVVRGIRWLKPWKRPRR